jgi:hypothetical protein
MAITKGISTQIKKRKQMSKQMTAVEWLEQEFIALQKYGVNELGLFAKAKEMEEQQIIDACEKFGNLNGVDMEDFKQYYNDTFNK